MNFSASFLLFSTVLCVLTVCINAQVVTCPEITCGSDISRVYTTNNIAYPCTAANIESRFTKCVDNKKALFYYWKPPATCQTTTMNLPAPVADIDCAVKCDYGSKFDPNTKSCVTCGLGQYGEMNSLVFNRFTDFVDFPQLKTSCSNVLTWTSNSCNPWSMKGDYVYSGENSLNHGARTVLEYNLEIAENSGTVNFEYMIDAEPYERFYVQMDSVDVMYDTARSFDQKVWKNYTLYLEPGFHNIKWVYEKDYSISEGKDAVFVRNMIIKGTPTTPTDCRKCPAGTFQNKEGQMTCRKCPVNTYQDETGQSSCKPCGKDQSSFEGSTSCFLVAHPCTVADYYTYNTKCDFNTKKMTKKYAWIEPVLCNRTHENSVKLPSDQELVCPDVAACPSGEGVGNFSLNCEVCPPGSYQPGASKECISCTNNFGGARALEIDNFAVSLNEAMRGIPTTTGCTGNCLSKGWRVAGSNIDSGNDNGISVSWIEFNVEVVTKTGFVEIFYISECTNGQYLDIMEDEQKVKRIYCTATTCNDPDISKVMTEKINLSRGTHKLRLEYVTSQANTQCNTFKIEKIKFGGALQGGLISSEACPLGWVIDSNKKICSPCAAGSVPSADGNSCQLCEPGTFSREGYAQCDRCGRGTNNTQPGSSYCNWEGSKCNFETKIGTRNLVFDWSRFGGRTNTSKYSVDTEFDLYINFCEDSAHPICGDQMLCLQRKTLPFDIIPLGNSKFLDIDMQKLTKSTPDQLTLSLLSYLPEKESSDGNVFKTYLNLRCNLDTENPAIFPTRTAKYGLNVTIEAKEICHQCGEDDYLISYSGCVNNVVIQSYAKLDSCFLGIQKKDTTAFCLMDTYNLFIYVLIAGIVVFVALLFGSCCIISFSICILAFFVNRTINLQNSLSKFKKLDEDLGEKKADNQEDELSYAENPEKAKKDDEIENENSINSTGNGNKTAKTKKEIELKNASGMITTKTPNNNNNEDEDGVDLDLDDI